MVTAGLQEALQPALEARRTWPPLAQSEDASRMIAGAVQQLVESAGARLLAAAVGQGLRDHPGRQQGGRWQQEQQQQQRHGGPGDLGRWRPGLRGLPGAPASSPYTQAFFSWLRSPSRPAPHPPTCCPFVFLSQRPCSVKGSVGERFTWLLYLLILQVLAQHFLQEAL